MTQYLLSVAHAGSGPDISQEEMQQSFQDVDAVNTDMMNTGAFVFAGGLTPPATSRVARVSNGKVTVSDGPYIEAKEHIGGFWIIEAPDIDKATDWARRATVACRLPVEVRALMAEPPEAAGQ